MKYVDLDSVFGGDRENAPRFRYVHEGNPTFANVGPWFLGKRKDRIASRLTWICQMIKTK
jgi:hypothetical protein